MIYPFMTLNDKTEIVHSDTILYDDGTEHVKVYMERPCYQGFDTATCFLPEYLWSDVKGFSDEEMKHLEDIVKSTAHLIIQFSRQGGFANASNF